MRKRGWNAVKGFQPLFDMTVEKKEGRIMKILVSGCLLGENCKYNGGNNYSEKVAEYIKGHQVISVCPECLGGLPTPRVPSEIVNGVVINREGQNVDAEFRKGAEAALDIAKEEQIDEAILQSRSPEVQAAVSSKFMMVLFQEKESMVKGYLLN